jgi:sugar lactone lactonase YvrE
VQIGAVSAHVALASPRAIGVIVPAGLDGGRAPVRVDGVPGETLLLDVGTTFATGVHLVDNPVFDYEGNLYATYSGSRGQEVPVSIFRIRPQGTREPFASGIVNPTAMAFGSSGDLFVSSRFEGTIYRVRPDATVESFATEMGVACGLAFGADGSLFVGDRSGTIFQLEASGKATAFATLPASVAAFHLAFGPDEHLYVTAPTLSTYDHVYRVDSSGRVEIFASGFGRPQGLAFDVSGHLMVIEALAGASGLYRVTNGRLEQLLAAPGLVGVALDPIRGLVISSNDTIYRLDVKVRGTLPRV